MATFNLLHGRSPTDGRVDVDRLAEAVRTIDADVLALQEVDHAQPRSGYADLAAVAAEAMGAAAYRFVPALVGTPGGTSGDAATQEQVPAPSYGIALLSRHPVSAWREVRLPRVRWGDDEPRVAVVAEVETPERRVAVAATHLTFVRWWSGRQLVALVRELGTHEHPALLVGDLNMGARRARRLTGFHALAEHPTFPADRPRRQLDHVLGNRPWPVSASAAVPLPLSDHRALVVDLL